MITTINKKKLLDVIDEHKILECGVAPISIYAEDLDFLGYPPANDASDWGIIYMPSARMGSTVLYQLLNEHPDIDSEGESFHHLLLPLILRAQNFRVEIDENPKYNVYVNESYDRAYISPQVIRDILEVLRKARGNKPKFCTKGAMSPNPRTDKILPNHKKIMVVRNILDTISSLINQPWIVNFDRKDSYLTLYRDIIYSLQSINRFKKQVLTVEFSKMCHKDSFIETMSNIFDYLEVNKNEYDYDKMFEMCHHNTAMGRWKKDEYIVKFTEYLEKVDKELYDIIMSDGIWVPEDYELWPRKDIEEQMYDMPG